MSGETFLANTLAMFAPAKHHGGMRSDITWSLSVLSRRLARAECKQSSPAHGSRNPEFQRTISVHVVHVFIRPAE